MDINGCQTLCRSTFFACQQSVGEGSEAFALHLQEHLHQWCTSDLDWDGNEEKRLKAQFAKGLRDGAIKRKLQRHLRHTLQATFDEVCRETKLIEKEVQEAAGEATTCPVAATSG